MNISKKSAVLLSTLALVGGVAGTIAIETHAATPTTTTTATTQSTTGQMGDGMHMGVKPAAFGTVTAVSGNTVTITDAQSNNTYTVDATNAAITKTTPPASGTTPTTRPTPTTITVSGIAVGDKVSVEGTVSGTSITATKIMDGMMGGWGGPGGHGPRGTMGTVAAINGNTITLTGKNGTTYTINAGTSTVKKVSTAALSDIAVGDTLNVSGTTSGTTVTATNIVDGQLGNPKPSTSSSTTAQ